MAAETPVPATIPERVLAFLEAPNVATIGTTGVDGAPHQAVAWYRLEADGRILLNSRTPRRWPADLQRDPRVSIAVQDAADPMRWVGLSGTVETVIDDVARARNDICELAERYSETDPEDIAAFRRQQRISFLVRIHSVHDHLGDD